MLMGIFIFLQTLKCSLVQKDACIWWLPSSLVCLEGHELTTALFLTQTTFKLPAWRAGPGGGTQLPFLIEVVTFSHSFYPVLSQHSQSLDLSISPVHQFLIFRFSILFLHHLFYLTFPVISIWELKLLGQFFMSVILSFTFSVLILLTQGNLILK